MSVVHRVTGYDKRTEWLSIEHKVPDGMLPALRMLAHVPEQDVGAVGCYPLDPAAVIQVGSHLHTSLNVDAYDWFLEPFSE